MPNKNELSCSVIIPVYNAEKFIEQTLNSVINQTVKNIEIICVDDCSKDNSVNIIKSFQKKDDRIILIQNEKNLKVSKTRNKGVENAKANWVALLDCDDMWENDYLEKAIARRDETNGKLICSSCKFISNEGDMLDSVFIVPEKISYKQLLKQNKIMCSSVFIEKELLKQNPFYADQVHEDFLCWLNILKKIGYAYAVTEPKLIYRLTKGSKSRNKLKAIKMSYQTYKLHGCNFFKRLFYTFCNAINGLKKYSKIKTKKEK